MSQIEKLLARFLSRPKDFTYSDLKKVLEHFGYAEHNQGKTSGSRVAFFNNDLKHIIRLHKPHPQNELKRYQLNLAIEELKRKGLIHHG